MKKTTKPTKKRSSRSNVDNANGNISSDNFRTRPRRSNIVAEIYPDMYTGKQVPVTPMFFDRLAVDYVSWARDDKNAIRASQFDHKMGIPYPTFLKWCASKDVLVQAHANALGLIADRREVGMLQGMLRERPTMYRMFQYDSDWKAADAYWSEIKKAQHADEEKKQIVMVIDKLKEEGTAE